MRAHERDERIGKRLRPFEALKVLILFARSTPEAWQAVVAPAVSVTGELAGLAQLQKPIAIAAAWIHPLLRLAYIGMYLGNVPAVRGLCWAGALTCSGLLYVEGLKALLVLVS